MAGTEERDGISFSSTWTSRCSTARGDQAGPGRLPGRGERPDRPGARRPAAVGDPGAARPGAVHAEEPAQVHAGLGPQGRRVGGAVPARGDVRALRRPADAAVVRQPAGGGVPPDADAGRPAGRADPPGARPRPAGDGRRGSARRSPPRTWSGRRSTTPGWPARPRPAGPRACTCSCPLAAGATAEEAAAATRAVAARAERLDPALATTAFIVEDRGGKVFVDSTRAGGATVVAAYSPRVRPGVPVSFPVPGPSWTEVTPADFTVRTAPGLSATGTRGPS